MTFRLLDDLRPFRSSNLDVNALIKTCPLSFRKFSAEYLDVK